MSWNKGLFDCFSTKDAGLQCCFNQCCCSPCVYSAALIKADIPNAGVLSVFNFLGYGVGNITLQTSVDFLGRRAIVKKYGIQESAIISCCNSCFCCICAQAQELNEVLVKEKLSYGCGTLVKDNDSATMIYPPRTMSVMRR